MKEFFTPRLPRSSPTNWFYDALVGDETHRLKTKTKQQFYKITLPKVAGINIL